MPKLGPFVLFTTEKNFANRWVGNRVANWLGLHLVRILVADAFDHIRWALHSPTPQDRGWISTLRRDGVVAIPDLLPREQFEVLQAEVMSTIARSLKTFPPRTNLTPGFGAKEPFDEGFDRFDGGTLNRYLSLSLAQTPSAFSLVTSERFRRLYASAQGRPVTMEALSLYYLRHGPKGAPDLQKDLHRDTFHFTIKCWYFVQAVKPTDGPFMYVKGSNRSTLKRLAWEHHRARHASERKTDDGSFRITEAELDELDLPAPTMFDVAENTLVIADTHGFHRRGDANPGAERFAIYGGMRRSPYLPR